jgi:hypothetical protein
MTVYQGPVPLLILKPPRLTQKVFIAQNVFKFSIRFLKSFKCLASDDWDVGRKACRSPCKVPLFVSDFNQNQNVLKDINKIPNINFHEDLFSHSLVLTCKQTDMVKLIGAFMQHFITYEPKNGIWHVLYLKNMWQILEEHFSMRVNIEQTVIAPRTWLKRLRSPNSTSFPIPYSLSFSHLWYIAPIWDTESVVK